METALNRWARGAVVALCVVASSTAACSSETPGDGAVVADSQLKQAPRDWQSHPAILEIDEADEIYALSDVHGAYVELGRLLQTNGLISDFAIDPARASDARWTGGSAILVVAGDLVDKGAEAIGAIDLLRSLQEKARAGGGRVVVTMGNHEAEFLADPLNDKAMATGPDGQGFAVELRRQGIDPKELARGRDPQGRGAWLASLPFGVRIKKWFFAHGGNTDGETIPKLAKRLTKAVDDKGYDDDDVIGSHSILEDQEWYGNLDDLKPAKKNAEALGVKHIAFGHDPGALKHRGEIRAAGDGVVVKLNVNMGLAHESKALLGGALLHVKTRGTDVAEAIDASGTETPLF